MDISFKRHGNKLECLICPHNCKLDVGRTGICGVRKNTGDSIELLTYGVISGMSLDPVEKKPLYHFFPGNYIFSIGSYGCNMRCDFCQNYHISQNIPEHIKPRVTPQEIVKKAQKALNNIGIAFTYNEPVIWFEFMRDTAIRAKEEGLITAMISNGFVNSAILDGIISFTDAFNIDLKAFNNSFYKRLTGSDLDPVKYSLRKIAKAGRHLEITTLIIPGQNDSEDEMKQQTEWIAGELGKNVPFHLSRYFPTYKRSDESTDPATLKRLFEISAARLNYVYLGNIISDIGQNTQCPECGTLVTKRTGYTTTLFNLTSEGKCSSCGNRIYDHFTFSPLTGH